MPLPHNTVGKIKEHTPTLFRKFMLPHQVINDRSLRSHLLYIYAHVWIFIHGCYIFLLFASGYVEDYHGNSLDYRGLTVVMTMRQKCVVLCTEIVGNLTCKMIFLLSLVFVGLSKKKNKSLTSTWLFPVDIWADANP